MGTPTTRDIARLANVSQSTVSLVLSGKEGVSISEQTRARVLQASRDLGYARSRPRPKQDSPTVALLAPTLSNPYYPFLLQNIQLYASSLGIQTLILNTLRDLNSGSQALKALSRCQVDGVLCLHVPNFPLPERLPVVIVSEKNPGSPNLTVSLNSYTAGYMMADHLLSLGHERIAYITGPFENITNSRKNRYNGIAARMAESGLDKYLTILMDDEESELWDTAFEFNSGRALAERLLRSKQDITAIIAVNDMTAAGCMSTLQETGIRVPSQIAVCGFDNLLISRMLRPQLTSIDQMAYHGSKMGLNLLLDKIHNAQNGDELTVHVEYEPKLFVRGSTNGV